MNDIFLNISEIQHFSVGDGDGIRTTIFFKGCNLHCPWCHNPETWSPKPQILICRNTGKKILYGKQMSISEIISSVMEDIDFYEESGGGVTLSGGEAMLQADGASVLAHELKERGISVIMDTAGDVSFSAFEKINPYIDRYFFDLKASNSYDYRKIIGGNFDRIISNMKRLIYLGKRTHIRIPLIPNFNTSDEYIDSMCELIGKTGASQVELLPFHRLGCGKYTALGIDYPYRNCPPLTADETAAIASKYKKYFSVKTEA